MEDIIMLMMSVLPVFIYRFDTSPIKIPEDTFDRNFQNNSKIYMEKQMMQNAQNNLKKNRVGFTIIDFKT